MLYDECRDQVNELFSYVKTHLSNDFEYQNEITKMISDSETKHYLLDDAFIILCYIINNGDYPNISTSFSIRDFNFGELNRKLLMLIYEYYDKNHSNETVDPNDIFPEQCNIFSQCNTTFLQPSSHIIDSVPNKAKVVEFHIRNCKNMVFDIKPIIDDEYIKTHFDGISTTTGVNDKIIKRFSFLRECKPGDRKNNNFIIDLPGEIPTIYQKLDDNNYRELVNNKIQEKNYNLINYNLAVTNWENKRLLAMRQTIPKPVRAINHDVIKGSIKTNIYEKGMRIADAIFNSYNNPNLSDNDVLQITIGAQTYQDKFQFIKRQDFDKLFSIRDLESNII